MVADNGGSSGKRPEQIVPDHMARRSFHPVDLARDLAKAALPQGPRNWLRRRLTGLQSRFPLIRRLLGPVSGAYRYVAPLRPETLAQNPVVRGRNILFSIVVPIWSGPPDFLEATIRSVQEQWYAHWELIIAYGENSSPGPWATSLEAADSRIQVLVAEKSDDISAGNQAIAVAAGEYIVFVDQNDALTADCLYELALAISSTNADFLYSDEDRLSSRGSYVEPFFKPDWSPDTLMGIAYARHVGCVRRSLLDETGMFRPGFDGAQDWDLTLRITEKAMRVVHVPKVLYHSNSVRAYGEADGETRSRVIAAGRRAREDALVRRGVPGALEAVPEAPGYFRTRPHIQGTPLISIIIPSKNNGRVLGACLDAIRARSSYRNVQIVVLDNGTTDPATLQLLEGEQQQGVKIIRHDAPFNYSELNNIGARQSDGELLLFLNDDTEVMTPDWLERMAGFAQLSHVGAVGAKLLYPQTGNVQHVGVVNAAVGPAHALLHEKADAPGYFLRNVLDYNWLAVTGACLMISRAKFNQILGFNERLPVAYNDVDLCFRLHEAGYFNVVATAVRLLHHESISRGDDLADPLKKQRLDADRERLYELHPGLRGRDPFYNPNLNPFGVHFEFRS